MKVLLTGASGFVGSHVLDKLCSNNIPTVILLRPTSDTRFIARHLPQLEVRTGSVTDVDSIRAALKDVTHVIHSAGCTKARKNSEFYEVNQSGTRNVLRGVNSFPGQICRLLHVSSLAVVGPATADKPAREDDIPRPVSVYGKSKLAAELEVKEQCGCPYTIVRPPAVYGPRDSGFYPMFKAVNRHIRPQPSAAQALSLVYAPDLAEAIVTCLTHPAAVGRTYFAASPEIVTGRMMAAEVASRLQTWTVPCPLPPALLWPVCLAQEILSRATGKAMLLNLQKYAELRAAGWVCDPERLRLETGCECKTNLRQGVDETLRWYIQNRWL